MISDIFGLELGMHLKLTIHMRRIRSTYGQYRQASTRILMSQSPCLTKEDTGESWSQAATLEAGQYLSNGLLSSAFRTVSTGNDLAKIFKPHSTDSSIVGVGILADYLLHDIPETGSGR